MFSSRFMVQLHRSLLLQNKHLEKLSCLQMLVFRLLAQQHRMQQSLSLVLLQKSGREDTKELDSFPHCPVLQNPLLAIQLRDRFSLILLVKVYYEQPKHTRDLELYSVFQVRQNLQLLMKYLLLSSLLVVKRLSFLREDTRELEESLRCRVLQNPSLHLQTIYSHSLTLLALYRIEHQKVLLDPELYSVFQVR